MDYNVYEDEGPAKVTLQLHKPALERITVRVDASPNTATGKFHNIYADNHYYLVRTLSNGYNLLLFINFNTVKFRTFNYSNGNLALFFVLENYFIIIGKKNSSVIN